MEVSGKVSRESLETLKSLKKSLKKSQKISPKPLKVSKLSLSHKWFSSMYLENFKNLKSWKSLKKCLNSLSKVSQYSFERLWKVTKVSHSHSKVSKFLKNFETVWKIKKSKIIFNWHVSLSGYPSECLFVPSRYTIQIKVKTLLSVLSLCKLVVYGGGAKMYTK